MAIDITVPRECIYKSFEGDPGPCPRCGEPLQRSPQTYLLDTWRSSKMADSFMLAGDFGWFCSHCPTVVINPAYVREMFQHTPSHWDIGTQFIVVGIVDLDAVPEEKHHLPLGDDDNPIPLVEFASVSDETAPGRPVRRTRFARRRRTASARKKPKGKKRRR